MKTTKKLNLNDLKVNSFVTSLTDKQEETVKGGVIMKKDVSPLATAMQICGCSPWLSLATLQDCTAKTIPLTTK